MKHNITKLSKPGGREQNQDYCEFIKYKDKIYLLLADGLGGHAGGEIASKTAVEAAIESLKEHDDLLKAFQHANDAVIKKQNEALKLKSMRTTFVMARIEGNVMHFGHLGDSRLYVFKNNKVDYITPDHSVSYALYKTGQIHFKDIRYDDNRNKVLKVLGDEDNFKPDIYSDEFLLEEGDKVLLCTDGFWEYITEKEMEKLTKKSSNAQMWLKKMEKRILRRAKKDHDNYSAVVKWI